MLSQNITQQFRIIASRYMPKQGYFLLGGGHFDHLTIYLLLLKQRSWKYTVTNALAARLTFNQRSCNFKH